MAGSWLEPPIKDDSPGFDAAILHAFGQPFENAGRIAKLRKQTLHPDRETLNRAEDPAPLTLTLELPPVELIHQILDSGLTIKEVESLRAASFYINQCVQSHLGYREILAHCPDILRVLRETNVDSQVTVSELVAVFRDRRCFTCKHTGAFLFLPTFQRCCSGCLEDGGRRYHLVNEQSILEVMRHIKRMLGISMLDNQALPKTSRMVSVIKQHHNDQDRSPSKVVNLLSFAEGMRICQEAFQKKTAQDPAFSTIELDWWTRHIDRRFHWDIHSYSPWEACVPCPFQDPVNRTVEHGLLCLACAEHYRCSIYPRQKPQLRYRQIGPSPMLGLLIEPLFQPRRFRRYKKRSHRDPITYPSHHLVSRLPPLLKRRPTRRYTKAELVKHLDSDCDWAKAILERRVESRLAKRWSRVVQAVVSSRH